MKKKVFEVMNWKSNIELELQKLTRQLRIVLLNISLITLLSVISIVYATALNDHILIIVAFLLGVVISTKVLLRLITTRKKRHKKHRKETTYGQF